MHSRNGDIVRSLAGWLVTQILIKWTFFSVFLFIFLWCNAHIAIESLVFVFHTQKNTHHISKPFPNPLNSQPTPTSILFCYIFRELCFVILFRSVFWFFFVLKLYYWIIFLWLCDDVKFVYILYIFTRVASFYIFTHRDPILNTLPHTVFSFRVFFVWWCSHFYIFLFRNESKLLFLHLSLSHTHLIPYLTL